ncbi:TIGR03986 family CRISPR-associated RAMP protein [Lamprobacter modestohalophilus]|uniref:TIGR03986 family CRISPR-associated RAMP protein n=1 Tax=Lamprobacter modestohalophilus TaxID=1064514 RepID=A0A9X0WB27_9GAMM|nr:TIGR03986 family CRISPR-associated RAMP protein [Lamprobacter modestohalophilus]MBK1620149.1 TIGR03986 family CRISPR-associated RAMP protein [Lamprobacter modestohalophilus]
MSASAFVKHLPQQGNPTEDDRVSRAPYNFVPLPERVVRAVDEAGELPDHDRFSPEGYPHSGWFEVRLTTETPLFIRAPLRSQQFAKPDENNPDYTKRTKNTPNFFHRGEITEPVIPGSSLRGMLRSLIEVIGYGKLTQVTERGMIYRAVGDTSSLGGAYRDQTLGPNKKLAATLHFDYPSSHLQGGYLCRYQGDWAIRPARRDAATFDESIIRVPFEQLGQLRSASRGNHKVHPIWVKPARREDHPRGNGGLVLTMTETPASIEHRDPQDRSDNKDGKLSAWLIESGVLSGKKAQYAIFAPDQNAKAIPIPHDMWEHYTDDRDLTRGSDERASRPLGKDKELLAGDGDPLFYLVDAKGKLAFFGPTMMFRLPYKRTPKDLIPAPLRQPLDIDLADALFGYIRSNTDFEEANLERPRQGDKAWAYAGRLSVSDAQLAPDENTDDLFLEPLTPRILGTPKPTTFQHYLVQGADASKHVRTPEDAIRASREALEKVNLSHYDSPSRDMNERECGQRTVLRGTKRYWHQGPRTTAQLAEHPSKLKLDSKQHTRMRPIAPTKSFVFRVRFDNLSDIELGALCWALHPRGHQGKEYRHQLGMGKPLGMGSIRLDAQLHLISRSTRYQSLFATDGNHWQQGEQQRPCPVASDTVAGWIDQFEQHQLAQLNAPKDCQRLADLRRIGALLRLMDYRVSGMQDKPFMPSQ